MHTEPNLRTEPNLQDADGFYTQLVEAHEGLDERQSFELNSRLIFLLANQIGDANVLGACIAAAQTARHNPATALNSELSAEANSSQIVK
jgi:hypothetical protein